MKKFRKNLSFGIDFITIGSVYIGLMYKINTPNISAVRSWVIMYVCMYTGIVNINVLKIIQRILENYKILLNLYLRLRRVNAVC